MSLTMEVSREQEIITEMNACLDTELLDEKDTQEVAEALKRRLQYWGKNSQSILKTYDLEKFCSSLTDADMTWEPEVTLSGTMEVEFTVKVPSKFASNPQRYLEHLDVYEVDAEYTEATANDSWVEYRTEISSTDAVFEKLKNSSREVVS